MSRSARREVCFEDLVEQGLLEASYERADPARFDQDLALDRGLVLRWLEASQPEALERLRRHYGGDAEQVLFTQLAKSFGERGTIEVLRRGISIVPGIKLKLCQFRPAHALNPATAAMFAANILTVTRQLRYSKRDPNKAIDLVLSVNGLPVATAELKNELTGTTFRHAEKQYQEHRLPGGEPLLGFKRCVAHFCVDTNHASLTTRLAGSATEFLPFNRGHEGGAGNPPDPSGIRTGYLWQRVWAREAWLDILGRFVMVERRRVRLDNGGSTTREELVFPRWHQLEAVLSLEADARARGPGHSYLIQHSAGSGKSKTIAWTVHRLAQLFDVTDRAVFDSVVVVTDRVMLDRNLQDQVVQFEQTRGSVRTIDGTSAQLKQALDDRAQIVVTTIQKFPVIVDAVAGLHEHRFAVIIDEAHSSQSGETASDLVRTLSRGNPEIEDLDDAIRAVIEGRGPQPNISFFAFTATPKARTLMRFGHPGADGKPRAFHLYPMRQAIEEGFILDVLANYITYKTYYETYYELEKAVADDPELDRRRADRALVQWMTLHPHNVAQKARVVVEHFRRHVRHRLGGEARAMVVTSGRAAAVRWWRILREAITESAEPELGVLVAFSGTVEDPDTKAPVSERQLNGFSEVRLEEEFLQGRRRFLVVAEKYQTGFDEPLLCAMYVDKKLDGLHAVQTLSRLNRARQGKDETFVLDFVNTAEDIRHAFEPYYEKTEIDQPTDPHQIYTLQHRIMAAGYLDRDELRAFAEAWFLPDPAHELEQRRTIERLLDAARDRFRGDVDDDARETFRKHLSSFVRFYGFLAQIVNLADTELEVLYAFGRLLLHKLPRRDGGERIEIGVDEIRLVRYRLETTHEGGVPLAPGTGGELKGGSDLGTGGLSEEEQELLSEIVRRFNERFATEFSDEDWVNFHAAGDVALGDPITVDQACHNAYDVFFSAFEERFLRLVWQGIQSRSAQAERDRRTVAWLSSDPEVRRLVADLVARRVYREARRKA